MQVAPDEVELVFEDDYQDESVLTLTEAMHSGPPSESACLVAATVTGDPCFYDAVFTEEESVYLIFDDDTYVLLWSARFPRRGVEVRCLYHPAPGGLD